MKTFSEATVGEGKVRLRTIFLSCYLFFFLLAGPCSLNVPPNDLPAWGLMVAIAIVGMADGYRRSRFWRTIWLVAIAVAIVGGVLEIVSGKAMHRHREMDRLKQNSSVPAQNTQHAIRNTSHV